MALFKQATKKQTRARIGLVGPSGSGKTFTALRIAQRIAAAMNGRVAVIDSERGSASKYVGDPNPDGGVFDFDVLEPSSFHPERYVEALAAAEKEGYAVVVVDSLSHAWMGKDGALEQVDHAARRSKSGSSFNAWRDVTPMHNALVDAMLTSRCHVIATLRAKTEYVLEKDEKTGKSTPRKIGMAPMQRDGLEYEFDVVGDLDLDHYLSVTKTRCAALDGAVEKHPGKVFADKVLAWLTAGAPPATPKTAAEKKDEPASGGDAPKQEAAAGGGGERVERDPAEVFDELSLRLQAADTLEQLEAVVPELKKLPADHEALPGLRSLYGMRKKKLAAATTKAA